MIELTNAQAEILYHATYRAANNLYCCGGGTDMDRLVNLGLMEFAGRKSFVPEPYYTITATGREVARSKPFRDWIAAGKRDHFVIGCKAEATP